MDVEQFADAASFLNRTSHFLLKEEAANNMILSSASALVQNPENELIWLATAFESERPIAAGLWIADRHMVLSLGSENTAALFADSAYTASRIHKREAKSSEQVKERSHKKTSGTAAEKANGRNNLNVNEVKLRGLLASPEAAAIFSGRWRELSGHAGHRALRLQSMRLDLTLSAPEPILAPGRLRRAWLEDLPLLEKWAEAMGIEGGLSETPQETALLTRRSIENRRLFVWEDRKPVAMAGFSGNTLHGARINSVYTPPEHRQKGYARSCVWQLGRWLAQTGKSFACLLVDRDNPTAVRLYETLGYTKIGDVDEYRFE